MDKEMTLAPSGFIFPFNPTYAIEYDLLYIRIVFIFEFGKYPIKIRHQLISMVLAMKVFNLNTGKPVIIIKIRKEKKRNKREIRIAMKETVFPHQIDIRNHSESQGFEEKCDSN
ncbi:CLUMA_CG009141, isoform A [Clunio marinus]|uniref:CLUMA_CG009141, isoform A n=1 Tax=Clunio marinus TaxID=568069 RepID=A0A1J1I664_9DIPT|nr:CLUMA_CG009141, isoform A [Clunio marinus]